MKAGGEINRNRT